ncbi:MAG: hypothetical protein Q9Q13_10605 [Acidobacteriota bacterium]|nr:hypothetical protein [Acidobacteriota bacterium]
MRVDRESLDRLEWGELTTIVARRMRTPMGRRRAGRLAPLEATDQVLAVQRRVEAMRLRQARFGSLPLAEVTDPGPLLEMLQVEGRSLQGEEIYAMTRLLIVGREVAGALRQLDPEDYPALSGEWARFPDLEAVIGAIEGRIGSTGELEDHASPELARLREEIRALGDRLTSVLEKLIQAEWTAPVLRDRYITVRNDRYVLPVRTDTPRRFHGIVHGSSATEKTLFVERWKRWRSTTAWWPSRRRRPARSSAFWPASRPCCVPGGKTSPSPPRCWAKSTCWRGSRRGPKTPAPAGPRWTPAAAWCSNRPVTPCSKTAWPGGARPWCRWTWTCPANCGAW